jgi:hypothetical protein
MSHFSPCSQIHIPSTVSVISTRTYTTPYHYLVSTSDRLMFFDLALNFSDPKSAVLELNFLHVRFSLVEC